MRFPALWFCLLCCSACDRSPAPPAAPAQIQNAAPIKQAIAHAAAARLDAPAAPLSPLAQLGRKIFFDPSLSASGAMSCSNCHSPAYAYAPDNGLPVQLGGLQHDLQGSRAVPSLTYLERTPRFTVRPDSQFDPDERVAKARRNASHAQANALNPVNAAQIVAVGGMDWDGRAAALADQASGPLFDPREMANRDGATVRAKLKSASYASDIVALFGPRIFADDTTTLNAIYQALARFQIEDRSFHRYDSKFDHWLAGRATLNQQEWRGMQLYDDPKKGNCATCHPDKPTKNRLAPAFTDYEFEALGAPRNKALQQNRDASYFDLGLCGPARTDLSAQRDFCGMFKTPTLRNVATRKVFFHNGVFHSLTEVVRFYVERETQPEKWYPRNADGSAHRYDDLPDTHHDNIDMTDAPFNRHAGDAPALNAQEIDDIIAFLQTLTDGYQDGAVASVAPVARN